MKINLHKHYLIDLLAVLIIWHFGTKLKETKTFYRVKNFSVEIVIVL